MRAELLKRSASASASAASSALGATNPSPSSSSPSPPSDAVATSCRFVAGGLAESDKGDTSVALRSTYERVIGRLDGDGVAAVANGVPSLDRGLVARPAPEAAAAAAAAAAADGAGVDAAAALVAA